MGGCGGGGRGGFQGSQFPSLAKLEEIKFSNLRLYRREFRFLSQPNNWTVLTGDSGSLDHKFFSFT
jgi:hypothetical protein